MRYFDAATYIAITVATIHLCPERSVEVFLLARGCIIIQRSTTRTREYRRHVPGRHREQEQQQALQPFQTQHFFLSYKEGATKVNGGEEEMFVSNFREAVVI